jgi:hypothetical protein
VIIDVDGYEDGASHSGEIQTSLETLWNKWFPRIVDLGQSLVCSRGKEPQDVEIEIRGLTC